MSRFKRSRLGPGRNARFIRPTCEAVESRALMAHLAVSIFGAGVAADVTAGPRSDSEAVGLGDSDYQSNPLAVANYTGAEESDLTAAVVTAGWQITAMQTQLVLVGGVTSNNDAPAGEAEFGTNSNQQNQSVGSPITLTIEPDSGEVNGQPVAVTLTSVVTDSGQLGSLPAQMSYSIDYGDDSENYFGGVLDSSGPTTSVNSTRTVTLNEQIGATFDFAVFGEIVSSAGALDQTSADDLTIQLTATLGVPGPAPSGSGSGSGTGTTTPPTSGGSLTTVRAVNPFTRDVVILFSGPVNATASPSAFRITSNGRPLKIKSVGGALTEADLYLARRLRIGQKIVVTIRGNELRDTYGREVNAASDGVAGSTGVYRRTQTKIPTSGHRI